MNQTFTITRNNKIDRAFQRKQLIRSLNRRFNEIDYVGTSLKIGKKIIAVLDQATDPNHQITA